MEFIYGHPSMFGTGFMLDLHQKCLMVLGRIRCLVLRIDIHSLVPLSERSQLPQRIEDMCWNEKHACCWSHFSVFFGQHLLSNLHREEQVIFPLILLLSQSSHHAIHVIEHVIVHFDYVIQWDIMPPCHQQGPISERPQYFQDILYNRTFIMCREQWPVFCVF